MRAADTSARRSHPRSLTYLTRGPATTDAQVLAVARLLDVPAHEVADLHPVPRRIRQPSAREARPGCHGTQS
jgi:hypothetical protein